MAGFTNQSFLTMIEEEYPDVDWDNLPSLDSKPTYWTIRGMQWHRYDFVADEDKVGFECGRYSTEEEALAKIESMKTDPAFCEEQLHDDQTVPGHAMADNSLRHKEYIGPVIFDSPHKWEQLYVLELPDDELSCLHRYKGFLDRIEKGEKVFPMYLP